MAGLGKENSPLLILLLTMLQLERPHNNRTCPTLERRGMVPKSKRIVCLKVPKTRVWNLSLRLYWYNMLGPATGSDSRPSRTHSLSVLLMAWMLERFSSHLKKNPIPVWYSASSEIQILVTYFPFFSTTPFPSKTPILNSTADKRLLSFQQSKSRHWTETRPDLQCCGAGKVLFYRSQLKLKMVFLRLQHQYFLNILWFLLVPTVYF